MERIVHIFHEHSPKSDDERRRNDNAVKTWGNEERVTLKPIAPRRAFGDDARRVPYLKDIFDYGCWGEPEETIVVWTNCDACLVPDAYEAVRQTMAEGKNDACYSGRINVVDASNVPPSYVFAFDDPTAGTDLIAFRPHWWRRVHREVPDFLIAAEAFDACLTKLIERDSHAPDRGGISRRLVYHEDHGPAWWETHRKHPISLHNRKSAAQFARDVGIPLFEGEDGWAEIDWSKGGKWRSVDARLRFDRELSSLLADTFIETGCGKGRNLKTALLAGFKEVIGIEQDGKLAQEAANIFGVAAVILSQDSRKFLFPRGPEGSPMGPTALTVLLDANFDRAQNGLPACPVLEELAALRETGARVIVTNSDIYFPERWEGRKFHVHHDAGDWPTLEQLQTALGEGYSWIERGTFLVAEPTA
ncbi:MAG TPA: hypothetical protein VK797_22695 [Tepidisphaeraceae bacterium]|nr:hypothetical protein [Tepidisphaeraceae bacterium]